MDAPTLIAMPKDQIQELKDFLMDQKMAIAHCDEEPDDTGLCECMHRLADWWMKQQNKDTTMLSKPDVRMALNRYEAAARKLAAGIDIKPKRMVLTAVNHNREIFAEHILWMVNELRQQLNNTENLTDSKEHKLMRWVSWIQGALCFSKMMPIQQGRLDNYKILNDGKDPE